MSVSNQHICSRLMVSADYSGSESEGRLFMEELPHMIKEALNYLSDELNDLPQLKTRSIRFSELSLEIGLIEERYFKDDFKNRLKKALFEKIEQIEMGSSLGSSNVESVDVSIEPERLIRHLLCFGTAPWWAREGQELRLKLLIGELMHQNPIHLNALLHEIGNLTVVRRRLIQRLDKSTLSSIIQLIEPIGAGFIQRFLDSLMGIKNQKGIPETDIRFRVWDAVLEYLLTINSRQFNRTDFSNKVIENLSSKSSVRKDLFIRHLAEKQDAVVNMDLIQSLKNWQSKIQTRNGKNSHFLSEGETVLKEMLLRVNTDIRSSVKHDVRKRWKQLFEASEKRAFKMIRQLASKKTARRNMSIFLPDKDLQKIVELAEPGHASFILNQSKRTQKVRRAIPDLQIPKAELKAKSWEFILTYLFEDKGSQFNRKQFLRSMLEQFAAHYNLRYSRLLRYFIILTAEEQSGTASTVHSLLTDLEKDDQKQRQGGEEKGFCSSADTFKKMTEKAGLLTFSGVAKCAEGLYQYAKHNPEQLSYLLKSGLYSEEGLVYIWNYLSRSQKGIVLMAVSSSKIRGWEQLVSQIESVAEQSAKITRAVELENVFDLVFRHGVLRDADMESLLSLYLKELARQNRSTKKFILAELEHSNQDDQDLQLLSYLKIQPDTMEEYKSDRSQTIHDYKKNPLERLLARIDAFFQATGRESSASALQLFKSLDEREMRQASIYITSKKGWEWIAEGMSVEQWREMINIAVSGELYDQTLAIYELCSLIHRTVSYGKSERERRQQLQGKILGMLMHDGADLNDRQLMRELLRRDEIVNRTNVKPEAIKKIQASVSSTQTPYFNQWLAWEGDSGGDSNAGQTESKGNESGDVLRVLSLLKKLRSATPDFGDRLLFPVLFRLLENREEAVMRELLDTIHDTSAVDKWSGSLPEAVLNELIDLLLPEDHLKHAKQTMQEYRSLIEDLMRPNSKQRVESEILFRYAAVHRYRAYSENEFVKSALHTLADEMPAPNRAEKVKELSVRVAEKLKERGGMKIKSIEKILKSLDAEAAKTPPERMDSEPSQTNEYNQLKKAFELDEQNFEAEAIYINRAGLILAAPFFPTLFGRLGYMDEKEFSDERTRTRAIHVMEYLATGRADVEEYQLVIQKLLAGLPPQNPVDPIESLTDEEIEMSDSMLKGLISNWPGLGNTTIEGLREAFFQREGRLQKADDHWSLTVQAKAYDVLLDSVPWSIGMIKLPWMEKMLRVEWR